MLKAIHIAVLGAALTIGNAFAAGPAGATMKSASAPAASESAAADAPVKKTKAKSKQQGKMATCNASAKEKALKGAERKQFMSSCLSA